MVVASIKLGYIGDDAKDTPLEHWLDACTFGKHELDSSKPFSTLSEELEALGTALYAPVLIESDWSERWGFAHYKAEAKVFLPGYSAGSSRTRFLIDGTSTAPVHDHYESGGRLVELQGYLPKRSDITSAKFEITYRPSDAIETPYTLFFRVPEAD